MTNARDKFLQIEKEVNVEVFERGPEIRTSMLALVAQRHHFQYGPPGIGKSFLVERISKRIEFDIEDAYFHWLMTQYTTPPELYGGPILPLMREGIYKLNTAKKLPKAYIVFLDEIFKGNSSILNSNLMIMNERKFINADDDPHIPLISMFGASNEMPDGEALNALWDRLHFRHAVEPLQNTSSVMKMLKGGKLPEPDPIITIGEILKAQREAEEVLVPEDIFDAIKDLRDNMKEENLYATDRRWVESLPIIRAEAWLRGRTVADIDDLRPLMHVLWEKLDTRKQIKKLVLDLANPIERDAGDVLERVLVLRRELEANVKEADSSKTVAKLSVETHGKLKKARNEMRELEKKSKAANRTSEVLGELRREIQEAFAMLVDEGFGLDSGGLPPDTTP